MPSDQHPLLVASVVDHVAAVGRLPVVDALCQAGPMPADDLASGAKVVALQQALVLRPGVVLPSGPLLLVDARCRSGWALTVAAALLRQAGADAVLPLVLHQLP
jgi:ATP-dependent DNA helicase RecQ